MNSTWYPEIEEPIKSREKHYSLVLYILIQLNLLNWPKLHWQIILLSMMDLYLLFRHFVWLILWLIACHNLPLKKRGGLEDEIANKGAKKPTSVWETSCYLYILQWTGRLHNCSKGTSGTQFVQSWQPHPPTPIEVNTLGQSGFLLRVGCQQNSPTEKEVIARVRFGW